MVIAAPVDGTISATSKIPLTVKFAAGVDATNLKIHLHGEDVSATFSPADTNGMRTATLDAPHILFGYGGVGSGGLTLPYTLGDCSKVSSGTCSQLGFYRSWFFLRGYLETQQLGSSSKASRPAAPPGRR